MGGAPAAPQSACASAGSLGTHGSARSWAGGTAPPWSRPMSYRPRRPSCTPSPLPITPSPATCPAPRPAACGRAGAPESRCRERRKRYGSACGVGGLPPPPCARPRPSRLAPQSGGHGGRGGARAVTESSAPLPVSSGGEIAGAQLPANSPPTDVATDGGGAPPHALARRGRVPACGRATS